MSENFGNCVVCGSKAVAQTGYCFMDGGESIVGVYFCEKHLGEAGLVLANPVFQNQKALELFMERHPQKYAKFVKGKRIVFLEVVR
jgi:hypothetical protein